MCALLYWCDTMIRADNRVEDASQEGRASKTPSSWLRWTPAWVKWDPDANHDLTWGMNILFGLVRVLPLVLSLLLQRV